MSWIDILGSIGLEGQSTLRGLASPLLSVSIEHLKNIKVKYLVGGRLT